MRATAKAVIKLFIGIDIKRWGFFLMKRAAGGVFLTLFFEGHLPMDQLDEIRAGQYIINKRFGDKTHACILAVLSD